MSVLTVPVSDRDHIRGRKDAAITLLEYGDYECPHCGTAFFLVEQLRQDLGDEMRFVYRHFPLTQIHPYAELSAEAAEAAGVQGNFWEMHDILFGHQDALDEANLIQYILSLGLDPMWFRRVLASHKFAYRIREDVISGTRSGVNGTPTFFINDVRYDGPREYEVMLAALREAGEPRAA